MGRPWRAVAVALVASGSTLCLTLACGNTPFGVEGVPKDGGAGDADAASAEAGDPCVHAAPPEMPLTDDAPTKDLPVITVAMSDTLVDENRVPGYDLDGVCTCETRPLTAYAGAESCRPKAPACDYPNGIDNGLGKLLTSFADVFDFADLPRTQLAQGKSNVLIQIYNYNGKANDRSVSVAILQSDGIQRPACAGSVQDPDMQSWSPGWCGDDPWTVRPDSLVGSVPAVGGRGYVSNFQLVARINGNVDLPFSEATGIGAPNPLVTGKLVPLGEDLAPRDPNVEPAEGRPARLWAITDGVLAARVPAQSMLGVIGSLYLSSPDGGARPQVCEQISFPTVVSAVCGGVDIAQTVTGDFAEGACDALSAAIPFEAKPAQTGDVFARTRPRGKCDPLTYAYRCP